MKQGWELKTLGEVCSIHKIKHHGAAKPYVGLEDIEAHTGNFIGTMSPKEMKSDTFAFDDRHVLYGRLRAYLNKLITPNFSGHCSSEIFPLLPGGGLDRTYLFYWLLSKVVNARIDATSTGARMPRANMDEVLTFEIPLPPLEEQKLIVAVLDEAFEGLETARTNAEENLKNAEELFQSFLNQHLGKEALKQEWEFVPLSSFAKTSAGGTPRKSNKDYYLNGTVPWLLSGEVGRRDVSEATNFITELGLANSSAKLFPANTVLVAMYGATAGETSLLRFEASTNQAVCGIFPSEKHIPEYLYYFFLYFKGELVKQAIGNAQPNISQQKIKNTEILLPPLEEQSRIVAALDDIRANVSKLVEEYTQNASNIVNLRQSLLQKAFAGKLT